MTILNDVLDELLKGCKGPEDPLGETGLMTELKVRLMERMPGAELTTHLGWMKPARRLRLVRPTAGTGFRPGV